MLATAADLPEELFALILQNIVEDDLTRSSAGTGLRHYLSSVSLTNRFWANYCRPHLFRLLRIESPEDVYQLTSLISDGRAKLVGVQTIEIYVHTIMIIPVEVRRPWIHLVHTILRPNLPHLANIHLGLEPARFAPTSGRPIRSIHHLMPKSLPGPFSNFHSLYLSDVQFHAVSDFVRLVSELPVLRKLHCARLSWEKPPHTLVSWYPSRFPRCLESLYADECSDNWVMFGLFARRSLASATQPSASSQSSENHYLSAKELLVACEILQLCQRTSDHSYFLSSNTIKIDAQLWASGGGYDVTNIAVGVGLPDGYDAHPPDVTFGIESLESAGDRFSRLSLCSSIKPQAGESHISTLIFDLVTSARWCWHTWECDWNMVGELAHQLPHLRRVIYGFVSKSNLDRFAQRWGETAMAIFSQSCRLQYAYITGRVNAKWISVDPVSLMQEASDKSYERLIDVGTMRQESTHGGSVRSWNGSEVERIVQW